MKLTTIVKDLLDRALAAKRVSALTGGTKSVDSIVITAGGTGYTSVPTVVFSAGAAAGTAILSGGIIVAVTITNRGSYTTPPTVSFTGGGGSGAAGTVVMSPTSLDAIITTDKTVGEFLVLFAISNDISIYRLKAGTDAEASPIIIRPDDYATTTNEKVWELAGISISDLTMAVGQIISIASGTNQRCGNAVLVGGTVTVSNTTVTANTKILLTRKTAGGTIGDLTYTLIAATSFTITSASGTDTSTLTYLLVEVP